jgi:hypothetical protein
MGQPVNYTITPGGIVYSFPTEEGHEERRTDDIADALPITREEIDATIKRVSKQIEAMEYELLG